MPTLALRQERHPPASSRIANTFSPGFPGSSALPTAPPPGTIGPNQYHRGPTGRQKGTDIGGQNVDDSLCLRFFLEPTDALHRRYEVLRAFFVERRPLKDIAQRSGYSYNTVRDLIGGFRAQCREGRVPPFS